MSRLLIRELMSWQDNYVANELLSEQAYLDVGEIFDLDMDHWWADAVSGNSRVFVIAKIQAPLDWQIVARAYRDGTVWRLDVAYHPSMAKVHHQERLQRIQQVLDKLTTMETAGAFAPGPLSKVHQGAEFRRPTPSKESVRRVVRVLSEAPKGLTEHQLQPYIADGYVGNALHALIADGSVRESQGRYFFVGQGR